MPAPQLFLKSSAQTHTPAADGMRQLAVVSEHEYLFTNNPLITSAGRWDKNARLKQENVFRWWEGYTLHKALPPMPFYRKNSLYYKAQQLDT